MAELNTSVSTELQGAVADPAQALEPVEDNCEEAVEAAADSAAAGVLLDRDHSILAFNDRVLDWAVRDDVPLLERLRYLCIVSSNLDEFFEVRAAPHITAELSGDGQGAYTTASFQALMEQAHDLVARQYALYNKALVPAFARQGIRIISHGERSGAQRRWVREYFLSEVRPLLIPLGLDPAHPFPQVANKALNFIVRLKGPDAFGRTNEVAIVKVPRALPRLVPMPAKVAGKQRLFVSLSSIVRAHLKELFPGREVVEFSQFRATRHSELAVDEEDVGNLRMALRQGLHHRHYGQAVRLEVSSGCSPFLAELLLAQFHLPPQALFRVPGPVNLVRLGQLVDLVNDASLLFAPWQPVWPRQLQRGVSVMAQLRQRDVLIHQPFESFEGVLALLREAVNDPQVLVIKQTIYRTGSDSELMDLLAEAVRRGKEVMAVVELKARFDEEANINWAERLEEAGAQVVYGVVGLKTHAKMALVLRREPGGLRRYAHLGTGNYNPTTAKHYSDFGLLTSNEALTADVNEVFIHLTSLTRPTQLSSIWLAPFSLQKEIVRAIRHEAAIAKSGKPARIIAKMNSLTDESVIRALYDASCDGVRIDLIVRGACALRPGVPKLSENIKVRSIVGRFLEHTRVFYFRNNLQHDVYLASADWMNRNLFRRVEVAFPVHTPALKKRVIREGLQVYLKDNVNAWELGSDGRYRRRKPRGSQKAFSAQQALMDMLGVGPSHESHNEHHNKEHEHGIDPVAPRRG